ncbi:MAG: hypothetical protein JRF69_10745 [Deltaproteobacteria bacterium]|nr:hypothetical protein [Deltaproteobacteria bacterium]
MSKAPALPALPALALRLRISCQAGNPGPGQGRLAYYQLLTYSSRSGEKSLSGNLLSGKISPFHLR